MISTKIFDINIVGNTKMDVHKWLAISLKSDNKVMVAKVNSEFLLRAKDNDEFRKYLQESDLIIPDGVGVLWAAKYLTIPVGRNSFIRTFQAIWQVVYSGAAIIFRRKYVKYPIPETIPGIEAFRLMLRVAEEEGSGVFIFGSSKDALDVSVAQIRKEFPKLNISGTLNGYDYQTDKSINPVEIINNSDAKVLFVCLGSPKQEYWIRNNIRNLKNIQIAVGEGGTLDRIASPKEAAPRWINRIGLEWLWRLFVNKSKSETGNRSKRVWNAVPVFIYEVVKWKIKNGSVPVVSNK